MGLEIERKFLVNETIDRFTPVSSVRIVQGYLSANPDTVVRIRIYGDSAFMTVKTRNRGAVRNEWEYEIPVADAVEIIERTGIKTIEKIRHLVPFQGKDWEVDVFEGHLKGLVLAEIELESEDEKFELPPFVSTEVTHDVRYFNSSLIFSQTIPVS